MKKILAALFLIGTISLNSIYASSIGDVALRFCNDPETLEKTISLTTSGQEEKEICMTLINWSSEDSNISISFVDWTVTNDSDQKKACKNDWENQNFWQYMSIESNIINVPAKWQTTFTGILKLPEEAAWEIHGCVTYFIANETNQKEMFTIMVRRANFIDVFAKWVVTIWLSFVDVEAQTESLSNNPKIVSFFNKEENNLYIQAILNNKGTAEQWITIKWEIKNPFGYKKTFFEEKRTLFAKQNSMINNVISDLPRYKWPLTITYTVEHSANIAEWLETDIEEKSWIISETTNIFIVTIWTFVRPLILLTLIAIIIFFIIRRKNNKTTPKKKIAKSTSSKKTTKISPKKRIKKIVKTNQKIIKK